MSDAVLTTLIVAVVGPVVLYVLKTMQPKNTISNVVDMYESFMKELKAEIVSLRDLNRKLQRENEELRRKLRRDNERR